VDMAIGTAIGTGMAGIGMYALSLIPDEARAAVAKYIVDELSKHDQPARLPAITRKRIVQGWEERELSASCC
jgi:hypothetical protein